MAYNSPIATTTHTGVVQVGSGLAVTPTGVLSTTGGGGGTLGTWTPTIVPSAGSITISVANANYFKIGQMVFCTFDITVTASTGGTNADTLRMGGLPFTAITSTGYVGSEYVSYFVNMNSDTTELGGSVISATTTADLWQETGNAKLMSAMVRSDIKVTTRFVGTVQYISAS